MSSLISMSDFQDSVTGKTNWAAYKEACLEGGQTCTQCGAMIYPRTGRRSLCSDCQALDKNDAVNHDSRIRCPRCRHHWNPAECDEPTTAYEDGDHEITCEECGQEFTVTTHVSYSYDSPKMIQDQPEAEEPEPDDGAWACGTGGPDC